MLPQGARFVAMITGRAGGSLPVFTVQRRSSTDSARVVDPRSRPRLRHAPVQAYDGRSHALNRLHRLCVTAAWTRSRTGSGAAARLLGESSTGKQCRPALPKLPAGVAEEVVTSSRSTRYR